jgi:hypothetical protein
LTQAYARAEVPIYGIPAAGTSDLRTVALQLRYAISPKDEIVLQGRHRRLGESMLAVAEDDVQLQWAFYRRRMGNFSVRVGKVPMPMGFYNEIRNVGTLIPFYKAPVAIYPDGFDTFDGVNVNYDLSLGSWSVGAAANLGSFGMAYVFPDEEGVPVVHRYRGTIKQSGTLTVNTPITGLRVRGSLIKFDEPSASVPNEMAEATYTLGSVDGSFTHFNVQSEYGRLKFEGGVQNQFYAQAGIKPHERVTLNTQYETSRLELQIPDVGTFKQTSIEDVAVGANYALANDIVLKLEGHRASGFTFDNQAFGSPKQRGNYVISSLSVSF